MTLWTYFKERYLYFRARKIGQGVQYSVYACGHGRVIKIPASSFRRFCIRLTWIDAGLTNVFKDLLQSRVNAERSFTGLQGRISENLSPLLGNPLLLDDFSYEQDLVKPVGEYFAENDYSSNVIIVDKYIDSILDLWRFGISDAVFNVTINSGVDRHENVILLDLGELIFNKDEVRRTIWTRRWLTQFSYLDIQDVKLRSYYAQSMLSRVTIESLDDHWKSAISNQ